MSLRVRLFAALLLVLAFALAAGLLVVDAPLQDELILFGVAVAIGSVLSYLVAGAFTKPFRVLASAATDSARGNLATRIEVASNDELGALAGAFNEMSERLRKQIGDVEASRDEVRKSVSRLGEALRSTHDMRKMLSVVLETTLIAVQGKAGAIYLLSAKRSELYVKVARHLDPSVAEHRIPLGRGLAGWVAEKRQAIRLPSNVEDGPVAADPEPTESTALAVPLESQSQLLGVLVVYGCNAPEPFREEDLDTIQSLARQAGIGIENVLLHQEAERLSITDGLTGIWNYRYFQMNLAREFERANRWQRPLSLLMIDIDHFKQVNDRYGHQRGDAVLIELAQRIVSHVRLQIDILARYGGEEFILILPETGIDGARIVAQKIRDEIAHTPFGNPDEIPIEVTVSAGCATYPAHGTTPEDLLRAADRAMYAAKSRGRDQVAGADELNHGSSSLAPDPARP